MTYSKSPLLFRTSFISKLKFHFKRCFSEKFSLHVLPEVESLLESKSMKHRKHPGVNKKPPIILPENLKEAMYKLVSNTNEKNILDKADEMLECLAYRRLPIEADEVNYRLKKIIKKHDNDQENPLILTKAQRQMIKREISSEIKRWKPLGYNHFECLAYLAGRMTPNYASALKVFSQIKDAVPSFQPKTFFDFGSGVGSAVWAAHNIWNENIKEYFCVDASPDMNNVSQALLTDENSRKMFLKNISFRQFLPASENIKYDLVVSAFSLMDLPSYIERTRVIDILWRKTSDVMVIIEYGNLAGYHAVIDARDYVLEIENKKHSTGAHVLMPCPHDLPCPLLSAQKRPCGIYVPYESVFPRHTTEFRKDWISYVVMRKGRRNPELKEWPRIVMPILKRDKHVYCRVCCNDGELREVVATRAKDGKHGYRCARSSTIGDSLPAEIKLVTEESDDQEPQSQHNQIVE